MADRVMRAAAGAELPMYIYDVSDVRERARAVLAAFGAYHYPIKANPEPDVVRAVLACGSGIDACSVGDVRIAAHLVASRVSVSYTGALLDEESIEWIVRRGGCLYADSLQQIALWNARTSLPCGIRLSMPSGSGAYGVKFGIPSELALQCHDELSRQGRPVIGLHVHEAHGNRDASEVAARVLGAVGDCAFAMRRSLEHVNIGGGWPVARDSTGLARYADELHRRVTDGLVRLGLDVHVACEPGEAVVAMSGFLAARVAAVKDHPSADGRSVIVLDAATPVPFRRSPHPFLAFREASWDPVRAGPPLADVYGSANTGADLMATGLPLGSVRPGDVVIAFGQGAYARQLTGTFNERTVPGGLSVG